MNLNQMTPQMMMQNSKLEICTVCGGKLFKQVFAVRRMSRVYTGDQIDSIIPMPVLACADCGQPIEDMLSPDFFEDEKEVVETPKRIEDLAPSATTVPLQSNDGKILFGRSE